MVGLISKSFYSAISLLLSLGKAASMASPIPVVLLRYIVIIAQSNFILTHEVTVNVLFNFV